MTKHVIGEDFAEGMLFNLNSANFLIEQLTKEIKNKKNFFAIYAHKVLPSYTKIQRPFQDSNTKWTIFDYTVDFF